MPCATCSVKEIGGALVEMQKVNAGALREDHCRRDPARVAGGCGPRRRGSHDARCSAPGAHGRHAGRMIMAAVLVSRETASMRAKL